MVTQAKLLSKMHWRHTNVPEDALQGRLDRQSPWARENGAKACGGREVREPCHVLGTEESNGVKVFDWKSAPEGSTLLDVRDRPCVLLPSGELVDVVSGKRRPSFDRSLIKPEDTMTPAGFEALVSFTEEAEAEAAKSGATFPEAVSVVTKRWLAAGKFA